jgi:hydroxyacylglutathione hydrolase
MHAGHLSTGRGLAAAAAAEYILHASEEAQFPFRPVEDGDVFPLGNVDAGCSTCPATRPSIWRSS